MQYTILAVRTAPHTIFPNTCDPDVFIRVEGADEPRYRDARGQGWRRVESGELRAHLTPDVVPAAGDVIELRPWQG